MGILILYNKNEIPIISNHCINIIVNNSNIQKLLANTTHYGDPKNGCMADEEPVQIKGVSGDVCTPKCKTNACPTDVPAGTTVEPSCALQTTAGDKYCALMCKK